MFVYWLAAIAFRCRELPELLAAIRLRKPAPPRG
jgi:hypothetical protein